MINIGQLPKLDIDPRPLSSRRLYACHHITGRWLELDRVPEDPGLWLLKRDPYDERLLKRPTHFISTQVVTFYFLCSTNIIQA
jgi:hypothetical protein